MNDDLADLTIAEASRRIAKRQLSPVELTRALLDRIEALDPTINAFLLVSAETALREAKAAEEEIGRGNRRGPLHGIPYAAKDIIDVAGLPTTCHSKLRAGHRVDADATVVKRLREAGAVLIGKLALHEFATGGPAFDLPWPPARNPWKLTLHPGGSSSGSGAALAAGMVPAALGTDTGGSIRNPATCCGVIGMKPQFGRVSCTGVFPLAASLDHVGPMTRTVEDNALLLQAIAGYDPADPGSLDTPVPDFSAELQRGVRGLRIGVVAHWYREDVEAHPEQVRAIDEALDVLRRLGAAVEPVRLSPLQDWIACGRTIQNGETFALHAQDLRERPQDYAAMTRGKLMRGAAMSAAEYIAASQTRLRLRSEFAQAMRDLDVVVTLSSLDPPCAIDDTETVARTYDRQCRVPFNVTGTPAISVPTGFTPDGVPLAMQIAGRACDEATVYRVAHTYCTATVWCERRPALQVREPVSAQA